MNRRFATWAIIVIIFVSVIAASASNSGGGSSTSTLNANGLSFSGDTMYEGSGKNVQKVAVIPVVGAIVGGHQTNSSGNVGAEDIIAMIEAVAHERDIKGVIIEMDTPGGEVLASDEAARVVRRLRTGEGDYPRKPVVVWMRSTAASGGYYIASNASRIVAADTTITGSIGVIWETLSLEGLAHKVGVKPVVVKSGKLKDMGSPYRDMTPQEREIIQQLIMEAYGDFITTVADGRGMTVDDVKTLADGRIYTGKQAKKLGLVDELGGRDEAMAAMAKLLDASDVTAIRYHTQSNFFDALAGFAATSTIPYSSLVGDIARELGGSPGAMASSATTSTPRPGTGRLLYTADLG